MQMYNEARDGSGQCPCQQAADGCRYFQRVLNCLGTPLLRLRYWGAGPRLGMGESDGNRKE